MEGGAKGQGFEFKLGKHYCCNNLSNVVTVVLE